MNRFSQLMLYLAMVVLLLFGAKWLADSRRVVYFTKNGGQLVVVRDVHCVQ